MGDSYINTSIDNSVKIFELPSIKDNHNRPTSTRLTTTASSSSSSSTQSNIRINNIEIIKDLVEANADTKLLNFDHDSCFHLLFQNINCKTEDRLKILKLLNANIHDINVNKNIYGKTAWDCWVGPMIIDSPEV